MEFGRLSISELEKVKFKLPSEPAFNKKILKSKRVKNPQVYVGCAKWGRTEWVGKIYPKGTREKDFLKHYVGHYNSIELNATHHKLYGERGIKEWGLKAKGIDFLFCPKMYKGITHSGKLGAKAYLLNEFIRGVKGFGKQLGPIFVQVNETFSPKRKEELFTFLRTLPVDLQFFLEVRHPAWFKKGADQEELFAFLKEIKMGAVITDTAGRRDCAHMRLTLPKTFIRFVGNSLHPTDYTRIDEWAVRMKYWLAHGMEELYFFMHMHDEATSPELSVYLVEKMNEVCGLKLRVPEFVE